MGGTKKIIALVAAFVALIGIWATSRGGIREAIAQSASASGSSAPPKASATASSAPKPKPTYTAAPWAPQYGSAKSSASPKPPASASASASASAAPPDSTANPGEPTIDAKANAEFLFNRGVKLMGEGNYLDACPLLAESLRLDFGLGTLLYLSDCQEQIGQTASAWAGFKEAAELAAKRGAEEADREERARNRAAALWPKLSMLRVNVSEDAKAIAGLVIKRNGVEVGGPSWGQPLPVDPGPQKIEVTAPGYIPWSTTVDVPKGPSESETLIPGLEKAPDEKPQVVVSSGIDGRAMRISGLTIGGAGIVGILVGAGFGIHAIVTYNDAIATCENGDPNLCTNTGVRLQEDASRSALISTVGITAGAISLTAGALLFFLAPADAPAPKVGACVDSRGFFLSFGGDL